MSSIRENWGKLLLLAACFAAITYWWSGRSIHQPEGVLVSEEPIQTQTLDGSFTLHDHLMRPLANFEIRARVLSTESYWFDRPSKLSHLDLCLGWGPMSDSKILNELDISQDNRWWRWSSKTMPISADEISLHAANMHMIPADKSVASTLNRIRVGQIVHLSGDLIEATSDDGWHWKSSLTRDDKGDGSCEIVYVKEASATDH